MLPGVRGPGHVPGRRLDIEGVEGRGVVHVPDLDAPLPRAADEHIWQECVPLNCVNLIYEQYLCTL